MRSYTALCLAAVGSLMVPHEALPASVTLLFFDRTGAALSTSQARALSNNGTSGYNNDALVNPANLQVLTIGPLHVTGVNLAFDLPGTPAALAFNWPTEPLGYSLIILDNGGSGFTGTATVNFTYQAALDAKRRLDEARAARPSYQPSSAFTTAYNDAASHIATANGSSTQSVKGKEGQLALDQLAVANDALLSEYGVTFAKTNLAVQPPWLGLTIDRVDNYQTRLDLAASLTSPYSWIRVVFDSGTMPSDYAALVTYAKSKGIKILGQPVDSTEEKNYTRSAYTQRFIDFITAFPQIDAWELGNEVNGSWLSTEMPDKIADAAVEVRNRAPGKLSVLTLFWQLNTDTAENSMFNWARNHLPANVRQKIDVVLVSQYIEQAPIGLAFDQTMETLQSEFPAQNIGLGELGYWCDNQGFWWAFNQSDPTGAARRAAAAQFYRASLGYAGSVGGCFWWYFVTEFPGDSGLRDAVSHMRDELGTLALFPLRINFQSVNSAVPSGHYADDGAQSVTHQGAHGAWSYGWKTP